MIRSTLLLLIFNITFFSCSSQQSRGDTNNKTNSSKKDTEDVSRLIVVPEPKYETLTYEQLLNNSDNIRNRSFQGSFYPIRIFSNIKNLKHKRIKNQKILMLSTSKSSQRVMMLFPLNKIRIMREMTQVYEKRRFIYQPLGVFKSKYPLLQFISFCEKE
ncbi:MAG: hypothetical protein SVR08_12440 [Spirochaetota bacterium]|nr:hypothetical protein [Spirochaetota bacterium]